MAHATEDRHLVLLEAHAGSSAVPEAAAGQFVGDLGRGDGEPGGQALEHHDEGGAMGFTGGQEADHGANLLPAPRRDEAPRATPAPGRGRAQLRLTKVSRIQSLATMVTTAPRASHGPKG